MNEKEWDEELKKVFPDEVLGFIRPKEGIDTNLSFGTFFPQLLPKDPAVNVVINMILTRILSNDKNLKSLIEEIQNQLSNCDLRTATQILKGLMSAADKKKLDGIAEGATKYSHPENHPATVIEQDATHRFVTEFEKSTWNNKANANHGNHIPAPQTADNSKFLRNDNTWQSVTPSGIGAAPAGYGLGSIVVNVQGAFPAVTKIIDFLTNPEVKTGFYQSDITITDLPTRARHYLIVTKYTDNYVGVIAKDAFNTNIFSGVVTNGIWSGWKRLSNFDDIVDLDNATVGDISYCQVLKKNHVKANGAVLKASEYPRLKNFVIENNLSVSESGWQAGRQGMYVYNATADTLRVPNIVDRFIQGADSRTGETVNAGLPNITGKMYSDPAVKAAEFVERLICEGAFETIPGDKYGTSDYIDCPPQPAGANFDASRCSAVYGKSDTVQPPAVKLIVQIKY